MKSRIIEELGQTDVLLPSLVARGLAANDRIKVRMSALQAAAEHARNRSSPPPDLTSECHAAGIDPDQVGQLVSGAKTAADGRITAPNLGDLGKGMLADIGAMIDAVRAGATAEGEAAAKRLAALNAQGQLAALSDIDPAEIAKLTTISVAAGDSLHRLVMDLHKALNRLAAGFAQETVAGAHAYGLTPDDHSSVEAFMRGIATTSGLKFNHPGLATTATRSGARLTIQNDIGATDAHVVVIGVEDNGVTLTYTDVHRARAKFFADLLSAFPVRWSGLGQKHAEGLADGGTFYLISGVFKTGAADQRNAFLEAIGASLVFLIDWNKARKVLRTFVAKDQAISVLAWAARNRFGHRGFLELGGDELVTTAVRNAAPARIGFGERLDKVLGREAAVDFLKGVLRIATQALREGRSVRLARDRVEADFVRRLKRVDSTLLAIVVRQAGLAREIAASIAHFVSGLSAGEAGDGGAMAARARRIEEKADRLALEARSEIARLDAGPATEQLVNRIEEAIDELEQAAFIASLMPAPMAPGVRALLSELSTAALAGTEAAAAGTDAAAEVPKGHRVDSEDALAAVGRLVDIEHKADDAERAVTAHVLRGESTLASSLSALELARALERATDRLASFGHVLRAHVLADLAA
jgi:uncharacterized protein Yka (UPF0111/DUF47 family)